MRHRARQVMALGLSMLLLAPGFAAASQRSPTSTAPAEAATRGAVGTLTPHTLQPGQPRVRTGNAVMPFHTLAPGPLRAAKLRAAAHASVGQRLPQAPVHLPLTGLFNGLNGSGLSDYAATPPDSTGAIGPTRYVEMVNQQIGVFDRNNLALLSSTDNGSFTGASILDSVSDPQIQWDGVANRWFYSAIGVSQGDNSLLFGWSKTADPSDLTNGWCRFGIGRGSDLDDYPKLGHDDDFIFIGSNVFSDVAAPNYTFETATLWAIPKPASGDASCAGPSTAYYFADAAHPLLNQDGAGALQEKIDPGLHPFEFVLGLRDRLADLGGQGLRQPGTVLFEEPAEPAHDLELPVERDGRPRRLRLARLLGLDSDRKRSVGGQLRDDFFRGGIDDLHL